jgi:hypothetical protein
VLVVEGATERLLFPRVMRQLGLRTDADFISIVDAEGVRTNLAPLVAYAAAPQIEDTGERRYRRLLRPPTRVLVVLDPEGPFATKEQRERRRQLWIERLMRTLPQELQTEVVLDQVGPLVDVATWKRSGESFEFAHFTDRQLALAIEGLDFRPKQPTHQQRLGLLAKARQNRKSIDSLLSGVSKVDLADEIWPVLERRIARALAAGSDRRIPIVRVVHRAVRLANQPRSNIVLALER